LLLEISRNKRRIQDLEKELQALNSPTVVDYVKQEMAKRKQIELKAQQILRECIGNEEFEKLLTKGYLTFKAKDGLTYKITSKGSVYRKSGSSFERLCIIKPQNLPLPDFILAVLTSIKQRPKRYRRR